MIPTAIDSTFNWLLITLPQNFVTTAILAPCVWLLCRIFHQRPVVQHLLWLLLLVKLLTPPLPGLAWNLPGELLRPQFSQTQHSADVRGIPSELSQLVDRGSQSVSLLAPSTHELSSAESTPPEAERNVVRFVVGTAALVWILGASRLLVKYFTSFGSLRRILHNAKPADPRLSKIVNEVAKRVGAGQLRTVVSTEIASPFISCVKGVQLVWPQRLDMTNPDLLRSLIAHEAAHVRRRDHVVAWLELIASIIWWWNPVFWFVRRQLRCTAEMACDAIALDTFPDDRCLYAEKLLELSVSSQTGTPPLVLAVGGSTKSSIERRIVMIVSNQVSSKLGLRGLFVAIALGLCAAPGWALTRPDDDDRDSNPAKAIATKESGKAVDSHKSTETSQGSDSKERIVTLSDGAKIPLDSEGMLVPKLLGTSYVVGWNSPLTIAESGEPIPVRLSETPLVLDLRKGDGTRQALIQVRAIRGPVSVQLQSLRAAGADPIRLEIRISDSFGAKVESAVSPAKITLQTSVSDIEVTGIEGSISIRKITISEGRTISGTTNVKDGL